jgi:hypothetical protein
MRRVISLSVLVIATAALAREPPPVHADERWNGAFHDAEKELAACRALTGTTYGDIVVAYNRRTNAWRRSSSKSLGPAGEKAAACVQTAVARHFHPEPHDEYWGDELSRTLTLGAPVIVLPPIEKLLGVWRRARTDASARKELAALLPPDYEVRGDGCIRTTRESIGRVELAWLGRAGAWVPRLWDKPLAAVLGEPIHIAMWRAPDELIVESTRGLCIVSVPAAKQVALRAEMDKVGSCWAGGFEDVLLHPRFAFPTDVAFTQVATQSGRACALSTAGEITCCGRPGTSPPKGPFTQVAVGGSFDCALNAKHEATCWGEITTSPPGPFTKLSADYSQVCGVRPTGEIVCWGSTFAKPPKGAFTDVAGTCGLKRDHSVECWGTNVRQKHPAGSFARIAADEMHACGVRTDGTVGCWAHDDASIDSPIAGTFTDVAVAGAFPLCARRADGTITCTGARTDVTPPPAGAFKQLAGDHDMMCAVGADQHVACWGQVWPGTWLADSTYPYGQVPGLNAPAPPAFDAPFSVAGRIVDEHGAPLAGVDVLACAGYGPCTTLASKLMTSPETLAQLATAEALDPASTALRTTGADGRWTATIRRGTNAHWGDPVALVVTAPGREIAERAATDPSQLAGDIVLRPAASLDVDLRCGKAACTGNMRVALDRYRWFGGTHLEHLAPGTYALETTVDFGQPGERRGTARFSVTFAGGAQHVTVAVAPVGSGKTIRGTAVVVGPRVTREGISVHARCEGASGTPVYRDAKTDASGAYELRDVGSPPCTVQASGRRSMAEANVTTLPAKNVELVVPPAREPIP